VSFQALAERSARTAFDRLARPATLRRRGTLDDIEISALLAPSVERDDGGGQPTRVDEVSVLIAEVATLARGDQITLYATSAARAARADGVTYRIDALARAGLVTLAARAVRES
jgi:hypothetical protein